MNTKIEGKFAADAMKYPLYVGDPRRLKAKLDDADGILRTLWDDFRATTTPGNEERSQFIYLPALLGDEAAIEQAREQLINIYQTLRKSDTANDYQFHTWCRCGTVTRQAAFFDWLAYRGAWSQDEIEDAADCFLGYAFKHPYAVLTGRGRSSNNQALSMALHLAVVGFLFGYKLAQHPTGRFLFDYGIGRIPDLIGLFPGDGYGGEGSTYTSHVNTPLAFWLDEFLKQITGNNYFATPFAPNGCTLQKMLEIEMHIMSPNGLLSPWDHYGWQPETNASPFAYLARATNNPRYLSLIPALNMWPHDGYLAWGADDQLWTLLWWPEPFNKYADTAIAGELFGWFLPNTGAALDDVERKARLMQVWDMSASTIAGIGRAQTNPNHVIFEYDGEPVFQDGIQDEEKNPWNYPAEKVLETLKPDARARFIEYLSSIGSREVGLEKVVVGTSPGLIGSANAIVIDDQPWYWPGSMRVGKPEFYGNEDGLQAVTAECANFYQPHFDVTTARRTSLWCDEGFGVIVDTLEAKSAHNWQWQVYLRPDVTVDDNCANVKLPNGKNVLLAWENGPTVRTTTVEGFPRTQEKRSCRLDLRLNGQHAQFAVVIAPEASSANARMIAPNIVEVVVDHKTHRFVVGNIGGEAVSLGGCSTTAPCAWCPPKGHMVQLANIIGAVQPDVHDLPDIEQDRDLQRAEFKELVAWDVAAPVQAGDTRISQIDACLAELPAMQPNVKLLLDSLNSPHWPVQMAAAIVLGRRGCVEARPALRALLEAEHAIPKDAMYPPDDAKPDDRSTEEMGKRWRLKAALIVASGRLKDREAVPLLGKIISDSRDFYIVYSVAAQALGRIGGKDAIKPLQIALTENEVNTHMRAEAAIEVIERKEG